MALSHNKLKFHVRTYGCQMNVHDTEKVSNLLLHEGWSAAASEEKADLLLINTCSIRDKAEHRLYSDLGLLSDWKKDKTPRVLGVGGCVAQQEGDELLRRFKQVDFVFGTHNLRLVPDLVTAALLGQRKAQIDTNKNPDRFDFPERHPDFEEKTPGRAFVTIMEGCDMFCRFCVVPLTRGREISREWEAILSEINSLARKGVVDVTLLGQTVNAYGRHDVKRGVMVEKGTKPFSDLIADIARVEGIKRVRYTSPHPMFFDQGLIAAHGSLPELCPHVHLPLQSGSNHVLELMRRRYDRETFGGLVQKLRESRKDLAITTDLIVGFPGESDLDFEETLEFVRDLRFVDSYSFKYSPRPGTPAKGDPGQVPAEVAQERLERLQALQGDLTLSYHRERVGSRTDVLITGPSRKGGSQWQGRDPYNRVVNFTGGAAEPPIGELVPIRVVEATPHSLIGEAFVPSVSLNEQEIQ